MERKRLFTPFAGLILVLTLCTVLATQTTSAPHPVPITQPCSFFTGRSCEECLRNVSCFWCITNHTCLEYPVKSILPPSSLCAMSAARWGACWINFEALIIAMGVIAGAILLGITICCCYCCYCRKGSNSRMDAEEENLIRERERRQHEAQERKNERTVKHNEIRKKYGLLPDMDHPYSKYENE